MSVPRNVTTVWHIEHPKTENATLCGVANVPMVEHGKPGRATCERCLQKAGMQPVEAKPVTNGQNGALKHKPFAAPLSVQPLPTRVVPQAQPQPPAAPAGRPEDAELVAAMRVIEKRTPECSRHLVQQFLELACTNGQGHGPGHHA